MRFSNAAEAWCKPETYYREFFLGANKTRAAKATLVVSSCLERYYRTDPNLLLRTSTFMLKDAAVVSQYCTTLKGTVGKGFEPLADHWQT